jgi:hypothetical protein
MTAKEDKPEKPAEDYQSYPSENELFVDDPGLENIDLTEGFDPSKAETKSSEQEEK